MTKRIRVPHGFTPSELHSLSVELRTLNHEMQMIQRRVFGLLLLIGARHNTLFGKAASSTSAKRPSSPSPRSRRG